MASIALGLALNERVVAALLGADGGIADPAARSAILVVELLLLACGVLLLLLRRRSAGARLLVALLVLIAALPLAAEGAFRAGITLGVSAVRDPLLYASWHGDDDHWKLRYHWQAESREVPYSGELGHDPLLGWTTPAPVPERKGEPLVLVYGDSFMRGVSPLAPEEHIAEMLARLLGDVETLDHSVPGHGFDQIYLRLRETAPGFPQAFVVLGIMSLDLDRSILSVRDGPKPYFELDGEELVLKGVPVTDDTTGWYREHPPDLWSYAFAFLQRRYRVVRAGVCPTESDYQRDEKQRVNRRLLLELARFTRDRGLPLAVVLFFPAWEYGITGWRELFLHEELERLGIPYVDAKRHILDAAEGGSVERFFFPPPNNHPNAEGNRIVARALAEHLSGRWSELAPR